MWIIDIVLLISLFLGGFNGRKVSINKDPTGQEGSNGTYIECLINMDGILSVREVYIYAEFNNTMNLIVTYYDYGDTVFSPAGEYLRDRVTYNTITGQSNRTELRFNRLQCEDETDYLCQLLYVPKPQGVSVKVFSNLSHLTVRVPPSRPNNLTVLQRNETYVESHEKNSVENLTFVEGNIVTATCTGEVGKPPVNLTMQKIHSNGTVYNLTLDGLVNDEMPNCSFYQRSFHTTTLAEDDNGSFLRCEVEGTSEEFIETNHFTILYPVRTPDVSITPFPSMRPPVMLQCHGRGNPDPDYTWSKLSNESLNWEHYSSNQSITLYNLKDSGVYMCRVNNSIGHNSYSKSRNITVTFDANSNNPDHSEDKENPNDQQTNVLGVVLGFAVPAILVIVIVIIVCYVRRENEGKFNEQHKRKQPTRQDGIALTSNYDTIDDELKIKRSSEDVEQQINKIKLHNDAYMKEQERTSMNGKEDPQTVVYAKVQKPPKMKVRVPEHEIVTKMPERASNPYASGIGIYDHMNDRRHKPTDLEQYDTLASIMNDKYKKQADSKGVNTFFVHKTVDDITIKTKNLHHLNEVTHTELLKEKTFKDQSLTNYSTDNEHEDTSYMKDTFAREDLEKSHIVKYVTEIQTKVKTQLANQETGLCQSAIVVKHKKRVTITGVPEELIGEIEDQQKLNTVTRTGSLEEIYRNQSSTGLNKKVTNDNRRSDPDEIHTTNWNQNDV